MIKLTERFIASLVQQSGRKIGTATIIIGGLIRCMQTFNMPRISGAVATGLPHRFTQRGNYQQCVFEDKDDFTRRMRGCLGGN